MKRHWGRWGGVVVLCMAGAVQADVVTDWNSDWQLAVKATGGGPGPVARAGAMLHAAIYDAVNSIDRTHEAYLFQASPNPTASKEAAVNAAALRVLTHLYPSRESVFTTNFNLRQGTIANGADKAAGVAIGFAAADAIIAARTNDGSNNTDPYVGSSGPGQWVPTEMGPAGNAWGPFWHQVTPFVINSNDQFRPPPPPALTGGAYEAAFRDVKQKGALVNSTRTVEETQIAAFWANDADGTWKPPGQLNHLTHVVSQNQNLSLEENARLFALINLAMADAGIVAWDAKFATDTDLWRPVTGIQQGESDGNPDTVPDPDWQPFALEVFGFTPPFPAYTSGHATFAAAHAAVMEEFFGTDNISFTIESGDPGFDLIMGPNGPFTRTFDSFSQAALENGRSRIFLGVHWQFDADFGYSSGTDLGQFIFANALAPVPEPATAAMMLGMATMLLMRRPRTI